MSTEIAPTPETAKKDKKRKKNRGEAEEEKKKHSKKRKREEQASAEATTTAEIESHTSPTKRKKEKKPKKRKHPAEEEEDALDSPSPTKKHKKQQEESQTKPTSPSPREDSRLTTHSPFLHQTTSLYLPLSPCASAFPFQGLCAEHLSPLLLTYYPPLRGVVLSYSNARIDEEPPTLSPHATTTPQAPQPEMIALAKCITDSAPPLIWLTATFLLFRPARHTRLEGIVSLQNESLLALVCYNYFNAVIPSEKLPRGWRWVHATGDGGADAGGGEMVDGKWMVRGSGWWVDDAGERVEGRVGFWVDDFEASVAGGGGEGGVSIVGTMLEGAGG